MIGDQGQGTPRQIVLSARPSGGPLPAGRSNPASNEALATIEHLGPWRRAAYGAEILALLHDQSQ